LAENIDDISINYEDDQGRLLVKEIKKEILTRGSWTTILFLFQEMDKKTGEYGPLKATIRRYKKQGGYFRPQSKFNISNKKQALKIAEVLTEWFSEQEEAT